MSPFASRSAFPLLCLFALLGGCASKNPLIDEPVAATPATKPAATASAPTAAPATATAAAAPAKPAETVAAQPASGVQTTEQRRLFGIFSPYRIDIQQGNFISREMVAQLRPGLTPDQVRFAMGTPLLTDIFHADRWDYVFRLRKGNGETITSKVSLRFKDGRLASVEGGNNLPTEREYLALISGTPATPAKPEAAAPAASAPAAATTPATAPAAPPAAK